MNPSEEFVEQGISQEVRIISYNISMLVSVFSRHFSPNEFLGLLELMGFFKMVFINNVPLKKNDMG
jgi:hypothetical protein